MLVFWPGFSDNKAELNGRQGTSENRWLILVHHFRIVAAFDIDPTLYWITALSQISHSGSSTTPNGTDWYSANYQAETKMLVSARA